MPIAPFFRRVVLVAGVAIGLLVLWQLREILLLAFAAALLATVLRGLADFIARHSRLPDAAAFGVAIVLTLGLVFVTIALFGAQVQAQANALAERLPQAIDALYGWLERQPWFPSVAAQVQQNGGGAAGGIVRRVGDVALAGLGMLGALVLVVVGALYFAAQPRLYRHGLMLLFPPRLHPRVGDALGLAGYAMRRWMLGQLVDMAVVGVLTGVGLWAIGAPSPLALGLLSGAASFVPYIGPIAAGGLAVLVASAQSLQLGLWTLALYVGVQQVENHLIMPFVQRWAIALPPALGIFAVVGVGVVLGPLGVVLATPLTVVLFVLAKKLYLRDTLGEQVSIKG
ncbi:MAG TPA: AI-2E family transporter [Burkholderiales bacterium]